MATLVLSEGDSVGLSLGTYEVVGSRTGSETVYLNEPVSGTLEVTFDPSFNAGGDTIVLAGAAGDYTIVRVGSGVQLTNGTITVTVPVGTAGADIVFANGAGVGDDDSRVLRFDPSDGSFKLGTQEVTTAVEPVDGGGSAPVTVSVDSPTVTEGDSGTKTLTFTLTMSEAPTEAINVSYSTAPGSATANDDYVPVSGSVAFAAGQTSATVSVQVVGDLVDENDETFTLTATYDGQSASGTATIVDNDEVQATLTPAQDTLVGTESDDVFVAQNNNLNAGDNISGLGGNDTLRVSVDSAAAQDNFGGFTTNSVELLQVTNDDESGVEDKAFDLSGTQGLTDVESINSSSAVEFKQIPNLVDVTITNLTNDDADVDVVATFQNAAVSGSEDEIDINVSESEVNEVRIGSNADSNGGVETVNLNVDGDSMIDNLNADVETLNIAGDGNIAIDDLSGGNPTNLEKIDATNASGNLTLEFQNAPGSVEYIGSTGADNVTGNDAGSTYTTREGNDVVHAGTGDDTIDTGEGADAVTTGGGNDTVTAGAGNDHVAVEGTGLANVDLGEGDDVVEYDAGGFDASSIGGVPQDQLDGGDGRDDLRLNESSSDGDYENVQNVEILSLETAGTTHNLSTMAQAAGLDTINLSTGNDVVDAGTFTSGLTVNSRDPVLGTGGDDIVNTGSGDDIFNFGGNLTDGDDLDAGLGNDTLNLDGPTTLDETTTAAFSSFETVNLAGSGDHDYILTLGNGNDPDAATAAKETLTINGADLGADDQVILDNAAVTDFDINATTGAAADVVILGDTGQVINTGAGDDQLSNGVSPITHDVSAHLGDGDDTAQVFFVDAPGTLEVFGEAGDDSLLTTGSGSQLLDGGEGSDLLYASGMATINGGAGDDMIDGTVLADGATIDGGDDFDILWAAKGGTTDAFFANTSNVEAYGEGNATGSPTILAANAENAGIRTIYDADAGAASTIDASAFSSDLLVDLNGFTTSAGFLNDLVIAGGGDDTVSTGSGNDRVISATGNNTLELNGGDDTVEVQATELDYNDAISGGDGTDEVELDNATGAVNAMVDLNAVTSIEQYTLTHHGDRGTGVDSDDNSLTFGDPTLQGVDIVGTITDIAIDASALTDADDSFTMTVDSTLTDADFAFIVEGAGAGVDVTIKKENLGTNNNITFNGAASNDSFEIDGDDLGSTIEFTGGTGTDSIVQTGGVIDDDGYRGVSEVENLVASSGGNLDATLGQRAEDSGLTDIVGGSGNDDVRIDAALDGNFMVDLTEGGDDSFDGDASDAVFDFDLGSQLDANDMISGGTTADDILRVNGTQVVADATNVTEVETIENTKSEHNELYIDTKKAEINGDTQTINVTMDGDGDNFFLGFVNSDADDANLIVNLEGVNVADLILGSGDDVVNGGDTTLLYVNAGAGDDVVNADDADTFASGGDGNDTLNGGDKDDTLIGDNGNDVIDGGDGHDYLEGGAGIDIITAGAGADLIFGGAGGDTIELSDDNVVDTVYYSATADSSGAINRDTVNGFESGTDVIDITAVGGPIDFLGNVDTFADAESTVTAGSGSIQAIYDQVANILYFDINDDGNLDGDDIQIIVNTEGDTGLAAADVLDPTPPPAPASFAPAMVPDMMVASDLFLPDMSIA